jgi:hypothetical protein
MPNAEKEMLLMICKYAEMVNARIGELFYRVKIAEATLQANPQFLQAYKEAVGETSQPLLLGLPRQLAALQQAVERLPD